VNVLSITHDGDAGMELFGPLVAGAGHRLDEWSFEQGAPPPLDAYDAVLVFGGFQHPDQDDLYPWLRDEREWLRGLIERPQHTLGICLGWSSSRRRPAPGSGRSRHPRSAGARSS
jgi:GMP synthase (glutamine-hydrolysing)